MRKWHDMEWYLKLQRIPVELTTLKITVAIRDYIENQTIDGVFAPKRHK